jgi:hypothetical protein
MKLFHLERTEDASGVSGIGEVAEGVVFEDGTVGLRWLTEVKLKASRTLSPSMAMKERRRLYSNERPMLDRR